METLEHTLCFTGHRPEKLTHPHLDHDVYIQNLRLSVHNQIVAAINDGYTHFYTGMAMGMDIWAGELVVSLRQQYPNLVLIAVVPFPEQSDIFSRSWKLRYDHLLKNADEIVTMFPSIRKGAYYARNRYMVDRSSRVIALYDGAPVGGTAYTVRYAKKLGREIVLVPGLWTPEQDSQICFPK